MGLGGILASMAQGFGGSMVKIADEAWKKEAEDRKFKFYADESEKDRVHKSWCYRFFVVLNLTAQHQNGRFLSYSDFKCCENLGNGCGCDEC